MIVEIKRRFRQAIGFRFDAMAAFLMCQHHGVDLRCTVIPAQRGNPEELAGPPAGNARSGYRKPRRLIVRP